MLSRMASSCAKSILINNLDIIAHRFRTYVIGTTPLVSISDPEICYCQESEEETIPGPIGGRAFWYPEN